MKKNKSIGLLAFLLLISISGVAHATDNRVPLTVLATYTEEQRQNISSQADLIIEGVFADVKMIGGKTAIDALARDPSAYENQKAMVAELPWVMTFDVKKVIKGEYPEMKFNVLVHSPGTQFGVEFSDPKPSEGKKYRIYVKAAPKGRVLIGQELLESSLPAGDASKTTAQLEDEKHKRQYSQATDELKKAKNEEERFYALGSLAKLAVDAKENAVATQLADELLQLAPKYRKNWNYGNAIYDANIVLGKVAISEGKIEEAKKFLLEAGKTPGSPQLDSFGPNMTLARALLEKNEREVVLQYFELCSKFWEMGQDQLKRWSEQVRKGEAPDFEANLAY